MDGQQEGLAGTGLGELSSAEEPPRVSDFEKQQQEFEHQRQQLQQELATILQQREAFGQRTCGVDLLRELERASAEPQSAECLELQERLQHELRVSQQQQLCQQMLQQLELEVELQKQEQDASRKTQELAGCTQELAGCTQELEAAAPPPPPPPEEDVPELKGRLELAVEWLEQLSQEQFADPTDDLEQRKMLWTYLQAELDRPQAQQVPISLLGVMVLIFVHIKPKRILEKHYFY